MFPKSIKLTYGSVKILNPDVDKETRPLPERVHLRGAKLLLSTVERDREITSLKLRSDYDALYDIELDISVKGVVGTVNTVRWVEST